MACDLSLNDAPVVTHSGYIPRNAIDHMNPFFFKSHSHHGHGFGHGHHHSHHHVRQQNYTAPYPQPSTYSAERIHTSQSSSSSSSTSSSTSVGLQTPVPKRQLAHLEPVNPASYRTPPATPPLNSSVIVAATPTSTTLTSEEKSGAIENSPLAWCTARARIPTPDGSEYFLHIYENKKDKKEHLAFVFGDAIRSQSLDKPQPGETDMDRIMRGAYTGRLRNVVDSGDYQQQQDLDMNTITAAAATITTEISDQDTVMDTGSSTSSSSSSSSSLQQDPDRTPLVRIHSECFTGEIGHSARCDCGEQLDEAIRLMKEEGSGVVVYLRQEGRGIGLGEKLKAYNLQDLGYDTVMANILLNHGADERTYDIAQSILQDLGLNRIRLLTNNPDKMEKIEQGENVNIKVVDRVPMMPKSWEAIQQGTVSELVVKEGAVENKIVKGKELDKYLKVKVERMRHLINIPTSL